MYNVLSDSGERKLHIFEYKCKVLVVKVDALEVILYKATLFFSVTYCYFSIKLFCLACRSLKEKSQNDMFRLWKRISSVRYLLLWRSFLLAVTKSVFQSFRKMSSTDPDETGFWGVISDCLDLSHTNDREGFEKVKEGIKVKKTFQGTCLLLGVVNCHDVKKHAFTHI